MKLEIKSPSIDAYVGSILRITNIVMAFSCGGFRWIVLNLFIPAQIAVTIAQYINLHI